MHPVNGLDIAAKLRRVRSYRPPLAHWAAGWPLRDRRLSAITRTSRKLLNVPRFPGLFFALALLQWAQSGPKIRRMAAETLLLLRRAEPIAGWRTALLLRPPCKPRRSWSYRDQYQ